MRSGALDQVVAVDEPVVADQDDAGSEIVTWTQRARVAARIEPLNGRERLQANAITGDLDARIILRWTPALDQMTAKWRLRHLDKGGVIYNIAAPPSNIDMANREIEVMANTGLNQG